ncbi:hypothetical protein JW960_01600 [candidate division KSB1 bacterium]|nr:hypothetical protein [candidate division KSB1 bacterium]
MKLGKYSLGIGDRFAHQGEAQLAAIMQAKKSGIEVTPVWNKSFREHTTIKSEPISTRKEADSAVKALNFKGSYFVDADHVGMSNIDFFIDTSDFFTLDVADFIGRSADAGDIQTFVNQHQSFVGQFELPGWEQKIEITNAAIRRIATKFLYAIKEAAKLYRYIANSKHNDSFIVEVSMDETDEPQSPLEMMFILSALAKEGVPVQTIAPKFTGRFNKGVDYVGDLAQFTKEFEQDVLVVKWAINEFGLPANLKLSVHSGSDKFSIYQPMHQILKKYNAGLHLKTAGTTWLEEVIGLAEAGGDGLNVAKQIYKNAYGRFDELCTPYATVIDVKKKELPTPKAVEAWDSETYANTLRHDPNNPLYNLQFRQMIHVAYKAAAELGDRYLSALTKYRDIIAMNVTTNIFERHIKPLYVD